MQQFLLEISMLAQPLTYTLYSIQRYASQYNKSVQEVYGTYASAICKARYRQIFNNFKIFLLT